MSERSGVIHDLGYRRYDGPRDGTATIARTLYVTGLRHTYGLGRSGKSKILPFILLAMAGVVVLPLDLKFIGLGTEGGLGLVLSLARWPVLVLVIGLFLAVVYRYGPSRDRAQWRWVSWGSAAVAAGFLAFSLGFSFFVSNFSNYKETYGSLGAVVGFMTWTWLSATVVLVGAELDAEMEHQTARDTTTGPELPMGLREARMADTLGAAA